MATYFPTKKGTDASVQSGQPPASNRQGGADAASDGAQAIIDNNQDTIGAFLHAQRQNVANSTKDYHRASYTSPDFDIHYTNHYGAETIRIDPKVQAIIAEAVAEAEALPTPAEEAPAQPVTPQAQSPGNYMMVLFKTDGIAAFAMDGLGPNQVGTPDYVGTSTGSKWTTDAGQLVNVGQFKLGGTGYIMTGIDLSAKAAATRHMLSTTALTDAVPTQALLQTMPVMNANASGTGIFTSGGGFDIDTHGDIVQTISMAIDGGVPVAPIAIANDGTSYMFPLVQGADITVAIDPKSNAGYPSSSAFLTEVNTVNEPKAQTASLPSPIVYCASLSDNDELTKPSYDRQTHDFKITVFSLSDSTAGSYVDGVGYYGKGEFGHVAVPQSPKLAQSQTYVEVFNPPLNHTVVELTPPGPDGSSFDSQFWLQTYTFTGGQADVLDVEPFPVTGTGETTNPLVANTNKDTFVSMFNVGIHNASATKLTVTTPGGTLTEDTETVFAQSTGLPGVTYPTNPGTPPGNLGSDVAACRAYYDTLCALDSTAPTLLEQHSFTAVQLLTLQDDTTMPPTVSVTGEYATPEDAPFPAGTDSAVIGSGTMTFEAACDLHYPYAVGSTSGGPLTRNSEVTAFGHELSFAYIMGVTTAQPPSIRVHVLPPGLKIGGQSKPFHTFVQPASGSTAASYAVVTPYGTFQGSAAASFTPWLHASNGTHCIQGFYVDDTPHLHVDEGTRNLASAIATACLCSPSDIVAVYMDIELSVITALANVQPGSFAQTP